MQDRSQIYSEEEYRYELENRMKNLLWTVSGDYDLDVNLDLDSFRESQYITLYDAVKQGAFARYFSKDEFGMYLVKKLYMGADEPSLAGLAQMCVDQAVLQKITAERKGVSTLRKKAFVSHKKGTAGSGRIWTTAGTDGYAHAVERHSVLSGENNVKSCRGKSSSRQPTEAVPVSGSAGWSSIGACDHVGLDT